MSSYNINEIEVLVNAGFSDQEIARQLGHDKPNSWRRIQSIRLRYGFKRKKGPGGNSKLAEGSKTIETIKSIDKSPTVVENFNKMSIDEKIAFLEKRFISSSRFRMIWQTLSADEKLTFQEEYFNIIRDIENLNITEEQSLCMAIYELILAFRAQIDLKKQRDILDECQAGRIKKNDPRFIFKVDDSLEKSYQLHLKSYTDFIRSLKLSREQRLHKGRDGKKTFLDFLSEVSTSEAQKAVAEKIRQLSKLQEDELKRLIDDGLILGYFKNDN